MIDYFKIFIRACRSALRDACLYYGAESFDAVLHAALPAALPRASRHPSHAFPVAAKSLRLPERCVGAASRHVSFLSMRALDALAALSLVHAPRFRQKSHAGQVRAVPPRRCPPLQSAAPRAHRPECSTLALST